MKWGNWSYGLAYDVRVEEAPTNRRNFKCVVEIRAKNGKVWQRAATAKNIDGNVKAWFNFMEKRFSVDQLLKLRSRIEHYEPRKIQDSDRAGRPA